MDMGRGKERGHRDYTKYLESEATESLQSEESTSLWTWEMKGIRWESHYFVREKEKEREKVYHWLLLLQDRSKTGGVKEGNTIALGQTANTLSFAFLISRRCFVGTTRENTS